MSSVPTVGWRREASPLSRWPALSVGAGTAERAIVVRTVHAGADRPGRSFRHETVARCRPARGFPPGTEWCPECDGYGSSLFEETERCTRYGGSGLVMVADQTQQGSNGRDPARPERQN
jgi:hypothetical protein